MEVKIRKFICKLFGHSYSISYKCDICKVSMASTKEFMEEMYLVEAELNRHMSEISDCKDKSLMPPMRINGN